MASYGAAGVKSSTPAWCIVSPRARPRPPRSPRARSPRPRCRRAPRPRRSAPVAAPTSSQRPAPRVRADGGQAVLGDQAPDRVRGGVGLVDAVAVGLLVVGRDLGRRRHRVEPDEAARLAADEVLAALAEQHARARAAADETRAGPAHRRRGKHAPAAQLKRGRRARYRRIDWPGDAATRFVAVIARTRTKPRCASRNACSMAAVSCGRASATPSARRCRPCGARPRRGR